MTQNTFSLSSKGMPFLYITRLVASLLALLFFSSCTMEKRVTVVDESQVHQLEKKNSELTNKLTEQKLLSKKLQQTLLIRHKKTNACWQANEKLIRALSQSKAKLATRGSKLEAATLIAEATAVISTMEQKSLNKTQKIVRQRALEHLKESKQEL